MTTNNEENKVDLEKQNINKVDLNKTTKATPTTKPITKTTRYKNNKDKSKKTVVLMLVIILVVLLLVFFVQLYKVINPNSATDRTEGVPQNVEVEDKTKENKKENKKENSVEELTQVETEKETEKEAPVFLENIGNSVINSENGDIVVTNIEVEKLLFDYYIVRGVVENRSTDTMYRQIIMQTFFYNKNGEMLDRELASVVDYNGIMPNEKQQFSSISAFSDIATTYEIEMLDDYESEKVTPQTKRNKSSGDSVESVNGEIVVENLSIKQREDGYYDVTGTVKNKSQNTAYSLVKMKVLYYDENGKIVDRALYDIVGPEGIKPNETLEFSTYRYVFGTSNSQEIEIMENYRIME